MRFAPILCNQHNLPIIIPSPVLKPLVVIDHAGNVSFTFFGTAIDMHEISNSKEICSAFTLLQLFLDSYYRIWTSNSLPSTSADRTDLSSISSTDASTLGWGTEYVHLVHLQSFGRGEYALSNKICTKHATIAILQLTTHASTCVKHFRQPHMRFAPILCNQHNLPIIIPSPVLKPLVGIDHAGNVSTSNMIIHSENWPVYIYFCHLWLF